MSFTKKNKKISVINLSMLLYFIKLPYFVVVPRSSFSKYYISFMILHKISYILLSHNYCFLPFSIFTQFYQLFIIHHIGCTLICQSIILLLSLVINHPSHSFYTNQNPLQHSDQKQNHFKCKHLILSNLHQCFYV